MICVLTTPIDLANYMDVANLHKRYPKEPVCHISWADLSGMQPDETLYLLGHGSATKVEKLDPTQLAQLLVKRGLRVPIRKIKLLACETGLIGPTLLPYCQRLADELVTAGGPATVVVGFDGATANTDEHGKTYAKDVPQRQFPNWHEFLSTHGKTMGKWDHVAEQMKYRDPDEILKNAEVLEAETKHAYKWLYENNRKYFKPSIVGKTYGIPGQKFPGLN